LLHHHVRLSHNNFDLLRHLFAVTVCLVHTYELSGISQLRWIKAILTSKVAVEAFFIVSGFLIFMSYERSTSVISYTVKRIRRIYPAYFFIVVTCAFVLFFLVPYIRNIIFLTNGLNILSQT
jgi:peptidoglycan/LPS O-acetylase OafA/YrhL